MNRLLALAMVIMAGILVWQIRNPPPPPGIKQAAVAQPAPAPAAPLEASVTAGADSPAGGIDQFAAMVERPLFVESRRPPSVKAATQPARTAAATPKL